jgi:hypothetical protein
MPDLFLGLPERPAFQRRMPPHGRNHRFSVLAHHFPEKAHIRMACCLLISKYPTPMGNARQHQPDRFSHCRRQMATDVSTQISRSRLATCFAVSRKSPDRLTARKPASSTGLPAHSAYKPTRHPRYRATVKSYQNSLSEGHHPDVLSAPTSTSPHTRPFAFPEASGSSK